MARRSSTPPPPEDFTERIVDVDVRDEMRGSFLEYAYSVIYSRAIPDARDGLKPVQRRILYQMDQMGVRPDRGHVKCARVVGEVMGRLHPHGDTAIYDALVRMAQPWVMRVPLVDGHGNFGSPDDGPAAYRYCLTGDTRVRLADGGSPRIADLVGLPPDSQADVDIDVLDKDGKPVRATKAFNSGVHPTRRLVTRAGFELRGSLNHPVLCLVPVAGTPMLRWLRLDQVRAGTVVCLARNAWTTAVPSADERTLGVLLGAWATGGFASERRAGYSTTDKALFDHVVSAYDRLVGGPRSAGSRRTTRVGTEIFELDVRQVSAFGASPLAAMMGRKATDKTVPEQIWNGGPGVKRAFLMAAFDGDGSTTQAAGDTLTLHFHSPGRSLARGVQDLLLEFGVHAHLSHGARGEHRLVVSGRHDITAFIDRVGLLTEKADLLRRRLAGCPSRAHGPTRDRAPYVADYVRSTLPSGPGRGPVMDSGYRFDQVAEVADAGPAEVYSLRVESADHSFLAGGFVNHNTECRLDPAALMLTTSLDEDVVEMVPNYDGREVQPEVLPSAFPNLLVNGASGIAVGMATNMPPHNLGEVVAAARHLLAHPEATLDDLMRHVPGPDLPTGGKIIGLEGIRQAYETGRGSFRTRAVARVENITPRRRAVVVTELPYAVGPEKVRERIADLVRSKRLQGVADVEDYSDRTTGLRLVIEIKSGFVPEAVLEHLYRLTPLEDSFAINNVALVEGQPRTLGLVDLLRVFVDHRLEVVRRRSDYRRRRRQERLHLVDGLLVALLDIDEVIALIRASDDSAAARERLMAVFDLSQVQAQYILDTPLRRLTRFDRLELEREGERLRGEIAELTGVLESPARLRQVVGDELADLVAAHGSPRRTVLLESAGAPVTASAAALEVTDEPCRVLLSSTGLLARTAGTDTPRADGPRTRHDVVVSAVATTTRGEVGIVTTLGRVLRLPVLDLPGLPPTAGPPALSGGAPVSEYAALQRDEGVLCLTSLAQDSPGLALGTERGVVKRVLPDQPGSRDAWEVVRLDEGDRVVGAVELRTGAEDLVFVTTDAQLLRFPAAGVRPQGRGGGGVAGIRLDRGARVVFFGAVAPGAEAVVVTVAGSSAALPGTQAGSVKVTPYAEYPAKGRATGGVRCHRLRGGEDTLLLAWAGPVPARAAAGSGSPVELPPAEGRRDGSGVQATVPVAAVAGPVG